MVLWLCKEVFLHFVFKTDSFGLNTIVLKGEDHHFGFCFNTVTCSPLGLCGILAKADGVAAEAGGGRGPRAGRGVGAQERERLFGVMGMLCMLAVGVVAQLCTLNSLRIYLKWVGSISCKLHINNANF